MENLQTEFLQSQELLGKLEKKGGFEKQPKKSLPDLCLNNSAAKLSEMLPKIWNNRIAKVLDLCGAPGGFAYLIASKYPHVSVYSFSKHFGVDAYDPKVVALKNVHITCSPQYGDITCQPTIGILGMVNNCQLILADGSSSTKNRWHLQEQDNGILVLSEIAAINTCLAPRGTFVLKLFNGCMLETLRLYVVLTERFRKVSIVKPPSSSPMSGEFYLVCKDYDGQALNPVDTRAQWMAHTKAMDEYVQIIANLMRARLDAIRKALNKL